MLYYYLAESLNELGLLSFLIKKMGARDTPLTEFMDDRFLTAEMRRIRLRASMDILIFGVHSGIFLNHNVTKINHLILHVLEMLSRLPELYLMNENELYRFRHCIYLKEELSKLSDFFYKLNETMSNRL
ncbi:hypothetical protein [Pedobacter hartonius]|uniref:Uncharacterized protein n=1 Tax=Pedobacter hartonius TaxID=425514 RepID=A0A1H4HEC0_9SPHI|nr:hypothetical protein [Pedobacter hartonius]SEB19408.1 hypothetical protein SAMN05443550_11573 [Pedobacter hartonius]